MTGKCKLNILKVSGCFYIVFLHFPSKPGKAGYTCCGRHLGSEDC